MEQWDYDWGENNQVERAIAWLLSNKEGAITTRVLSNLSEVTLALVDVYLPENYEIRISEIKRTRTFVLRIKRSQFAANLEKLTSNERQPWNELEMD